MNQKLTNDAERTGIFLITFAASLEFGFGDFCSLNDWIFSVWLGHLKLKKRKRNQNFIYNSNVFRLSERLGT